MIALLNKNHLLNSRRKLVRWSIFNVEIDGELKLYATGSGMVLNIWEIFDFSLSPFLSYGLSLNIEGMETKPCGDSWVFLRHS